MSLEMLEIAVSLARLKASRRLRDDPERLSMVAASTDH
jgi:hypothetical protein